ncbi:MAG: C39 family peptidase [Bacilli bacterium]|nr:C39 family peptidase [Bacilli bacterium]
MVSSSKVNSDCSTITSTLSKYTTAVSGLSGDWKGASYDNLSSKAAEFIADAQGKISKSMEAFATACDEYEKYLEKKQELKDLQSKLSDAKNKDSEENDMSSTIRHYQSKISDKKEEIETLKKQIKSHLSTASGSKVKGANPQMTVAGHAFVNYYQFDYNNPYSQGTIATSGCGPTSAAMALTYITGKEITPVETAEFGNGTYTCSQGTYWSYFGAVSEKYGVKCNQESVSSDNIKNGFKNGKPVIISMGPGHFTSAGHFIVLRGMDSNGKVIVADPNSKEKSNQTWDMDTIVAEGKQIWTFQ